MDGSIELCAEERKVLLQVYRSGGEAREARRAHVLFLLDDGLSLRQVRAITYASFDLINGCIQRFRTGGVTAAIEVEHNTSDEPFCLPQVAQ